MKELGGRLGDDFVLWFVNEMNAAVPEVLAREQREYEGDFHYPR